MTRHSAGDPAGPGTAGRTDRLVLRGLVAVGRHGVLLEEQERAQPFEVDLDVWLDMARAAKSDDLADSVDYGRLVGEVVALVETRSFKLMEALADAIASAVLSHDKVQAVTVELRKQRPPVPSPLHAAGVILHRESP